MRSLSNPAETITNETVAARPSETSKAIPSVGEERDATCCARRDHCAPDEAMRRERARPPRVDITSGSFEKVTAGANPHSGAYDDTDWYAAKNAADLETESYCYSAYHPKKHNITHARNNWMC
jgi:hypothetical protein